MFFGLLVAVAMYVVVVPQSVVLADDGLPPPRIYSETELVNGAEYIFVGRRDEIFCCGISSNATLASVEMASLDCAGPCVEYSTLHSVSVLDVIRGELVTGQAVSVEQQGGTMDGDKQFYVGDGPMVIGKEYLFLTNYIYGLQPSGVFSILGPGQGNIRLDDNPARDELVNHWRDVLGNLPCDVSDALVRDGVTYGRMRWNAERRFVPRGLIGAEIARTGSINSLANPCRGELPDLGASLLESGSAIHAIQGYEPGFRVAAFDGESYALYQVIWNSTAAVAEDIYDIRGRVALIGATQYSSCVDFWTCEFLPNPRVEIDVEDLVQEFLSAPVNPEAIISDGWDGRFAALVYMQLDDGSVVQIWTNGVHTLNGIELPTGFLDTLWRVPVQPDA